MEIVILCLNDELIRGSNLDSASKKVLHTNRGRYIAAEASERGWIFFVETLADSAKSAQAKWDELNRDEN